MNSISGQCSHSLCTKARQFIFENVIEQQILPLVSSGERSIPNGVG